MVVLRVVFVQQLIEVMSILMVNEMFFIYHDFELFKNMNRRWKFLKFQSLAYHELERLHEIYTEWENEDVFIPKDEIIHHFIAW